MKSYTIMQKSVFTLLVLLGVLVAILLFSSVAANSGLIGATINKVPDITPSKKVVVLELFTSQGCSSCPPADALLAEYAEANNEQIIPLSFHVDYWNRLGWTDPFSNATYSDRQQWYSAHLPRGSIYTPQLVVNGKMEAVGNNRTAVSKLVQQELKEPAKGLITIDEIKVSKNMINFHYTAELTTLDALINIALVQKEVITNIKAGENEGVRITNRNIVRSFITQPVSMEGVGIIIVPPTFKTAEYALVVYVQGRKDLTILAATQKILNE